MCALLTPVIVGSTIATPYNQINAMITSPLLPPKIASPLARSRRHTHRLRAMKPMDIQSANALIYLEARDTCDFYYILEENTDWYFVLDSVL